MRYMFHLFEWNVSRGSIQQRDSRVKSLLALYRNQALSGSNYRWRDVQIGSDRLARLWETSHTECSSKLFKHFVLQPAPKQSHLTQYPYRSKSVSEISPHFTGIKFECLQSATRPFFFQHISSISTTPSSHEWFQNSDRWLQMNGRNLA